MFMDQICNTVSLIDELRATTNYYTWNLGVKRAINSHSLTNPKEMNDPNGCCAIT